MKKEKVRERKRKLEKEKKNKTKNNGDKERHVINNQKDDDTIVAHKLPDDTVVVNTLLSFNSFPPAITSFSFLAVFRRFLSRSASGSRRSCRSVRR